MPADCLTEEEKATLCGIYRRDTKYWENWGTSVKACKRDGQCPLGLTWVLLPYKPGPEVPCLREQINSIYLQCLQEYAQQYNLSVCVDTTINKVVLYDPTRAPAEWLEKVIVPGCAGNGN